MLHAKLSLARRGPSTHETSRVHCHYGRSGGSVVAGGAGAAACVANSRLSGDDHSSPVEFAQPLYKGIQPATHAASEGRNLAIDVRWAEGSNERFAEIATEFTR